ncbi:hypothetical protein J0S82_016659 [Galemys pyrenaicus]|uniref:Uncharacterized protein n=1 Tax=Galemys pyrenaicus TaxID=202257 RepID=A0A8J6DX10_GALPY|nr:hypothetical protein J0S82_016659 [Galemys pyrenaicus]
MLERFEQTSTVCQAESKVICPPPGPCISPLSVPALGHKGPRPGSPSVLNSFWAPGLLCRYYNTVILACAKLKLSFGKTSSSRVVKWDIPACRRGLQVGTLVADSELAPALPPELRLDASDARMDFLVLFLFYLALVLIGVVMICTCPDIHYVKGLVRGRTQVMKCLETLGF